MNKNTEMILTSARLNRPIAVLDEKAKKKILRLAQELNVTIPEPRILSNEKPSSK